MRGPANGACPRSSADEPRLTLAHGGGGFLSDAAWHRRGGDRHQRQELDGRFPAPDLERAWAARRPRWARSARSVLRASVDLGHTTPDPVAIHATLDKLAREGVTHAAMEASSHGLSQYRLHGVKLAAGAFTNLTQDHLDYHHGLRRLPPRQDEAVLRAAARRARRRSSMRTARSSRRSRRWRRRPG